jgi:hypothetical protein
MLQRIVIISCVFLSACSIIPPASRWKETAVTNLQKTDVWMPTVAAILVRVEDNHISHYAREKTPVFGNQQAAENFSKQGKTASKQIAIASAVVAGLQGDDIIDSMSEQLIATGYMLDTSSLVVSGIKNVSNRERPDGSDQLSFPSFDAMEAFSGAQFTSENMHRQGWFGDQQWLADTLLYGNASAVAWSRIEAGRHYPSDVLVGAAIGNFFASWAQSLWVDKTDHNVLTIMPTQNGICMNLSINF